MAAGPTLPAQLACLAIERLREHDLAIEPVLDEAGLTPDDVSDPGNRIAYYQYAVVIEGAARALNEPSLGLQLGQAMNPQDLDLLGYICLNSATFGDVLKNVERYSGVYSEGITRTMVREGDTMAIVVDIQDPKAMGLAQPVELALSHNQRQMSKLLGFEPTPVACEVVHERLGPAAEYKRVLKGPMRFNAGRNATIVPVALLDEPILTADRRLLDILKRQAEDALPHKRGTGDIRDSVQNVIAGRLASGVPKIEDVARELGMSSRTLGRRLNENGANYRGLLEALRRQLALRYLNDNRHNQAQVAYLLGFTDVSSFSHAFKRWTGSPPSRYLDA